jgi:hypothetical protein
VGSDYRTRHALQLSMRTGVALLLITLGLFMWPAAVSARPLRLVDVGPVGAMPQPSGPWISWGDQTGATSRYAVRTGQRTMLPAPLGCAHVATDAAGDILYGCGAETTAPYAPRAKLRDAATGTIVALPAPSPALYAENGLALQSLGRGWYGVLGRGSKVDGVFWVSRVDGRVADVGDIGQHRVFDPDRPSLVRPLCRGMLVPQEGQDYGPGYGRLVIAGAYAAATYRRDLDFGLHRRDRVVLQGCDRTSRTLQSESRRASHFSDPVIDARIVAWVSYGRASVRLQVYSLRLRTRRSVAIPMDAQLLLTDRRLHVAWAGRLVRVVL